MSVFCPKVVFKKDDTKFKITISKLLVESQQDTTKTRAPPLATTTYYGLSGKETRQRYA
jgi:hypothetical protein